MSDPKIAETDDLIAGWTEDQINQLELMFLHNMFDCSTGEGVLVTQAYAAFISKVGLNSDNYPVFLKLLQFENHWVIDALIGDNKPENFFKAVQPNKFILAQCFKMFKRWHPGGIYPKSLQVLFGILKATFENPEDGNRIYPLEITDINNLGKHLNDKKDQMDPFNRIILEVLDRIASLNDPGSLPPSDSRTREIATQANNIRGKFLDMTKSLKEAIPDNLLIPGDYTKNEVPPLKLNG